MPRRYEPSILDYEQLYNDNIDLATQINRLNEQCDERWERWVMLIRYNQDQDIIDNAEKSFKLICIKRTKLMNKKFKINAEIMSRL